MIEAVAAHDANALAQLMRFPKIPCTTDHEGIGRPPDCPDGVADGTPIEALPIYMCEGVYITPGEEQGIAQHFIDLTASLYRVYQSARDPNAPEMKYIVMFSAPGTRGSPIGHPLLVSDDGVVGVWFCCDTDPDWIVSTFFHAAPLPLH